MGGYVMKQFCLVLAFMLILMPMMALATDRISEDLILQKELNLKSFDFEPKHVKMDGSAKTVNFLATIYADKGLLDNKELANFTTSATFLGPHSFWDPFHRDRINVTFQPSPILGDGKNGSYKGTMTLESGTGEGFWQLDSIKLVDGNGSVRELAGDDLGTLPKELEVEVGSKRWILFLLLIPLLFIGFLCVIYRWGSKEKPISMIWEGYDGATSTSKLQFFLWTMVVLYAYIIIVIDAYYNHNIVSIGLTVPQNLILAMGLSATTMLAAKGISSNYADTNKIDKSDTSKGGLFFDDDGYPDLAKIQLMAWTFVGIGIFLLKTLNDVVGSTGAFAQLPDIDGTLLALMGIGQGSYVGKKIITKDDQSAPSLDSISKSKGKIDDDITVAGTNFGDKSSTRFITIGGKKVKFTQGPEWEEDKVTFRLKDIDLSDSESNKVLPEKGKILIGVVVGSKASLQDMTFEIVPA
jgi:hypothetical protein